MQTTQTTNTLRLPNGSMTGAPGDVAFAGEMVRVRVKLRDGLRSHADHGVVLGDHIGIREGEFRVRRDAVPLLEAQVYTAADRADIAAIEAELEAHYAKWREEMVRRRPDLERRWDENDFRLNWASIRSADERYPIATFKRRKLRGIGTFESVEVLGPAVNEADEMIAAQAAQAQRVSAMQGAQGPDIGAVIEGAVSRGIAAGIEAAGKKKG